MHKYIYGQPDLDQHYTKNMFSLITQTADNVDSINRNVQAHQFKSFSKKYITASTLKEPDLSTVDALKMMPSLRRFQWK